MLPALLAPGLASGPVRAGRPSGTTGAAATAAQRTRAALQLFGALRLCSLTALRAQHRPLKPSGNAYNWLPPAARGAADGERAHWDGVGDVW